jgi:hypothetical protein
VADTPAFHSLQSERQLVGPFRIRSSECAIVGHHRRVWLARADSKQNLEPTPVWTARAAGSSAARILDLDRAVDAILIAGLIG